MFDYLDKTFIDNRPLIKKTDIKLDFIELRENQHVSFFTPKLLFSILLFLELLLFIIHIIYPKTTWKATHFYDYIFFLIMGFGSLALAFMWWGTEHIPTKENWNLLWMSPLFLILVLFYHKRESQVYRSIAFILIVINLLLLTTIIPIPQRFNTASYIIMAISVIKLSRTVLEKRHVNV